LSLASATVRKKGVVRLVADDGTVRATCSDRAIANTATAPATVHEPGHVAVSADRLAALVASFAPSAPVTLSTTESAAIVVCGNSHSRLSSIPWTDLPDALAFDSEIAHVEVSGGDCLLLLEPLSAAASARDISRAFPCGIFLHTVNDQLVAVCTDGCRLIRVAVSAAEFSTTRDLILPQEAAQVLRWLVSRTKPEKVTLRRSRTLLAVTGPDFEFISRLIDAKFPPYEAVFPAASPNFITCARSELLAALSRLAAVATADPPLLALSWTNVGPLKLFLARQPDDGADAIAAQAHGAAKVAVPLSQLAAMIDEFSGERVQLEAAGPLVIRSEGEKLALLMPSAWNFERGGSCRVEAAKAEATGGA
jgi:DNA polymerase III sliding clamp (beta) subunit (PCNA family)